MAVTPIEIENKYRKRKLIMREENHSVLDLLSLRSVWNIQVEMSVASLIYRAEA